MLRKASIHGSPKSAGSQKLKSEAAKPKLKAAIKIGESKSFEEEVIIIYSFEEEDNILVMIKDLKD